MPRAPKKCGRRNCEVRVVGRIYCDDHTLSWTTTSRTGSTRASRVLRERILERDPICTCPGCSRCTPAGCRRPSTEDDHLTPLAEGGTEDPLNHAGKCGPCHGRKTQAEAQQARRRARA